LFIAGTRVAPSTARCHRLVTDFSKG